MFPPRLGDSSALRAGRLKRLLQRLPRCSGQGCKSPDRHRFSDQKASICPSRDAGFDSLDQDDAGASPLSAARLAPACGAEWMEYRQLIMTWRCRSINVLVVGGGVKVAQFALIGSILGSGGGWQFMSAAVLLIPPAVDVPGNTIKADPQPDRFRERTSLSCSGIVATSIAW